MAQPEPQQALDGGMLPASEPRGMLAAIGAAKGDEAMASRRIYASSNGDTWDLVREDGEQVKVVHRPNVSSGGTVTTYALDVFLSRERHSPQNIALVELIGTLVAETT